VGLFVWAFGGTYEGQWSNDQCEGFGLLKCKLYLFEGDWVRGQRAGKGKIVFENGDTYDGDWLHDVYHGHGQYTFSDGRTLDGQWLLGKFVEASNSSFARESPVSEIRTMPAYPRSHEVLSFYEMMYPSRIAVQKQRRFPGAPCTKLMRMLVDTEQFRQDISSINDRKQEILSKISVLEDRRESLLAEESVLSLKIAEVTKEVEQRKVSKKIEEINDKVFLLRRNRDKIVSEHNMRIIEVMKAKISHLQNLKKELQQKLTIKRYREHIKMQQSPEIKSQDAAAKLSTKIPVLQHELNQAKVEIAELSLANFDLKSNLRPKLEKNRSLRSQLGMPPLPDSD
jgi:hypothetical protein